MEQLILNEITKTQEETEQIGAFFGQMLLDTCQNETSCVIVAIFGDLGVGKTAFVKGTASVLAPTANIHSPTYTIVNKYPGNCGQLLHYDMYRIEDEDGLESIGFWDDISQKGIAFMEWSENISELLPQKRYEVKIEKSTDFKERIINITLIS